MSLFFFDICLSVCANGTSQKPPNDCSWNTISGRLVKICRDVPEKTGILHDDLSSFLRASRTQLAKHIWKKSCKHTLCVTWTLSTSHKVLETVEQKLCSGDVMFPVRYELNSYVQSLCILYTQCVYMFHMILTINSDYFPKQNQTFGLCSGHVMCFLWGTNWILIYKVSAFCPHSVLMCSIWFSQQTAFISPNSFNRLGYSRGEAGLYQLQGQTGPRVAHDFPSTV
jgi:hypothetical protein